MLKGIPKILSPELLKILCEMGHNDVIVIGDGNFPGTALAKAKGAHLVRADGLGAAELLDAVLSVIPVDSYVDKPVVLMQKERCDTELEIPIWQEFEKIVAKHDQRGAGAIGFINRFDFYDRTKDAYAVIQTGEEAVYACVMIRKGVIK
ncbi:MAG: L-fucose mutarotase [Firmicutes bacterium ADurb.Bin182]|nr:MAG: L-fucose mutarotase [Firmicutes bacterium ADurb.Bin182]